MLWMLLLNAVFDFLTLRKYRGHFRVSKVLKYHLDFVNRTLRVFVSQCELIIYLFYSEIHVSMGQIDLKHFPPSLQKNVRPRDTRLVSGKCLRNTQLCLCACPEQPPEQPQHDLVVCHLPHAIPNWIFILSHFALLQSTQLTATAGTLSKEVQWYFFLEHNVQGTD